MTDKITPEIIERAGFILAGKRGWPSADNGVVDASLREVERLVQVLEAIAEAITEAEA